MKGEVVPAPDPSYAAPAPAPARTPATIIPVHAIFPTPAASVCQRAEDRGTRCAGIPLPPPLIGRTCNRFHPPVWASDATRMAAARNSWRFGRCRPRSSMFGLENLSRLPRLTAPSIPPLSVGPAIERSIGSAVPSRILGTHKIRHSAGSHVRSPKFHSPLSQQMYTVRTSCLLAVLTCPDDLHTPPDQLIMSRGERRSREPLLLSYGAKALCTGPLHFFSFEYGGRKIDHCVNSPETYTAPNNDLSASQ